MQPAIILGIIRHLLTTFGGTLVVTDNEIQAVIGAVMTIGGIGWSIYKNYADQQQKEPTDAPPVG